MEAFLGAAVDDFRVVDVSGCWDRVHAAVPEHLRDATTDFRYCCSYRHVEACWGLLDESSMVFDKSQGLFLDFTYSYTVCCFEGLRTQDPQPWML